MTHPTYNRNNELILNRPNSWVVLKIQQKYLKRTKCIIILYVQAYIVGVQIINVSGI